MIDGTGRPAIENSVLVIEGDHIVAAGKAGTVSIPKEADVKDVSGKTIMPTLINLHGHLGLSANGADSVAGHYTEENVLKQLNKYLSCGVSTVASRGQDEDEIYKIRDAQRAGTLGGARLHELAAHHPDVMKMWVDDGLGHGVKIKPEIYQAIIDEAHKQHIRVFAHEFYLGDAKALLAAGIDGFAHSIRDQPLDNDAMQTMKGRGVF